MSTNTRELILGRIRESLGDIPGGSSSPDVVVPRDYRGSDPSPRHELIDLFDERVSDYKAKVHRVTAEGLTSAIAGALGRRGVTRLAAPADLPDAWIPAGLDVIRDPGLTVDQIESCDGVLTGCALGIAQTGTIVLDAGPLQGRRVLTLLPDYHLCVVREDQVVGLVPEAIAKLKTSATAPGRPITLISGPSATSDIELNRVEGVHGPRTLEVLIVGAGPVAH